MIKDLIARRVPHYLGAYLAAGWGALEFTDWLVNRFVLSPHITDFALMAWALMMPTVVVLAYFHGRPGRDSWTWVEKVGIPINVLAAVAVLWISFAGRDLGAATTEVVVEDETGQPVERVVPKASLRERLAVFYLNNQSGDTALDWLGYGIPLALRSDLIQDIFLDVRAPFPDFYERLKEQGFEDGMGVPLALSREIAEELHLEHLVTGSIGGTVDSIIVTVELYDVERGKPVQRRRYTGAEPFELVDRMSVQLKRDLGVPDRHIEETPDLPFAELATGSLDAFRDFVRGVRAMQLDRWSEAAEAFSSAVQEDPTFALANSYLWSAYVALNETEKGREALQAAMDHAYKLPERSRFALKAAYYLLVEQDVERARRVVAMLTELFPEDVAGHRMQLQYDINAGDWEEAIAAAERVLELDPSELEMLRTIGTLYQELGRYDEARAQFERYAAKAPRDPDAFDALGDLSRLQGRHQEALDHYERALLLETDNVPILLDLARTYDALGQFDRAEAQLRDAVDAATTATRRYEVYEALREHYQLRGQMARAIEAMHKGWSELDDGSPIQALVGKLGDLDTYVDAGRPDEARRALRELRAELSPPFDQLAAVGELEIATATEDRQGIEEAIAAMEGLIETLGLEVFRPLVVLARAKLLELQGDCGEAIEIYERALELSPANWSARTRIGHCYRVLGRHRDAEEELRHVLTRHPFDARAHVELARVFTASGQTEAAIAHLDSALVVWAEASPEFEPAREARAERAGLAGDGRPAR